MTDDDFQWLSADEVRSWKALIAMCHALPAALDAQLKEASGLSEFEYYVMASLSEAPGRTLRMSRLALLAQGSLSRLSHAVGRLEGAGWVVRRPFPDDGRYTEAHLTAAGWRKVRQCAPGHVSEARRLVVDVLTTDELELLGRLARRITEEVSLDAAQALDSGL